MIRGAAAACALWLAATATAQSATLEVRLAADPDRRGPRAVTWLRSTVITKLPGWPAQRDPFEATDLTIDDTGVRFAATRLPKDRESYLVARLHLGSTGTLHVRGDFDGLEHWSGEHLGAPAGRLHDLVELLGLAHSRGPMVLEPQALIGLWLPGLDEGDPLRELLMTGPAECGELTFLIERDQQRLRATGRSEGGLLMPVLLFWLADLRARPPGTTPLDPITSTDRWLLVAGSARDAEREEAARQLALSGDPRAADMLERLLFTKDFTRATAMEALIRSDASASLPRLIHAVTPAIEETEGLALAALSRWLPAATPAERRHILATLPGHRNAEMRRFAARHAPVTPTQTRLWWVLAFGASAVALALALFLRRQAR